MARAKFNKPSNAVDGSEQGSSSVVNAYSDNFDAKLKAEKKLIDATYKYRATLEAKFNKESEKGLKKINDSVYKYEQALKKKLAKESNAFISAPFCIYNLYAVS